MANPWFQDPEDWDDRDVFEDTEEPYPEDEEDEPDVEFDHGGEA